MATESYLSPCDLSGESKKSKDAIRILLIGNTGAGKSSVGNTLLGRNEFEINAAGESVTTTMDWCVSDMPHYKSRIKIVDTPGVLNTLLKKRETRQEVERAVIALSPGPHVILMVFSPSRVFSQDYTNEAIEELKRLFKSDIFLQFAIIVIVRKNEILTENGEIMNIHDFVKNNATKNFQDLYIKCNKRIVSVENLGTRQDRCKDAENVMSEIYKLGEITLIMLYFRKI